MRISYCYIIGCSCRTFSKGLCKGHFIDVFKKGIDTRNKDEIRRLYATGTENRFGFSAKIVD